MKQIKLHKKTKYLTKTTKPNKNRETRYRCYLSTREYPFLSLRNVLSHHTSTLKSIVITRETRLSSLFKWFSPFDGKIAVVSHLTHGKTYDQMFDLIFFS